MARRSVKIDRAEIVEIAKSISDDWAERGFPRMTLRQIHYQFLKRGIELQGRMYRRIGEALAEARQRGAFPLGRVVDLGREIEAGSFTYDVTDLDEAEKKAEGWAKDFVNHHIDRGRWFGQETFVTACWEKQALMSVFEPVAQRLGIAYFTTRGYSSISVLRDWAIMAKDVIDAGAERCVILQFGDCDPDGLFIPHAIRSRLYEGFSKGKRKYPGILRLLGYDFPIEVRRIALQIDQARERDLIPFEAGGRHIVETSRLPWYVEQTGTRNSYELDALEPEEMQELLENATATYFDDEIDKENRKAVTITRRALRKRISIPGWLPQQLGQAAVKDWAGRVVEAATPHIEAGATKREALKRQALDLYDAGVQTNEMLDAAKAEILDLQAAKAKADAKAAAATKRATRAKAAVKKARSEAFAEAEVAVAAVKIIKKGDRRAVLDVAVRAIREIKR